MAAKTAGPPHLRALFSLIFYTELTGLSRVPTSAYVSLCYVSIRQRVLELTGLSGVPTSVYVSIRQLMLRQHTSAYARADWPISCPHVSIRQHTSAYATSAYVSIC
jgi:hypothetical protein